MQLQQVPIADEDAGQVSEAVPAQLEEAEVERDRIQAEVAPDDCVRSCLCRQGLPRLWTAPHKVAKGKGKGGDEELGCRVNSTSSSTTCWPRVIGPGGRLIIGEDEQGRAIVTNFPATLPTFFRTFCALNAQAEAIVAGEERLSFADLDRWSERLAHALVSRGIAKGDRVGIAMRNCPAWVVSYMAIVKAGGGRGPAQRLVAAARDEACARHGRAEADHRRCAARKADRGRLRHVPPRDAADRGAAGAARLRPCSTAPTPKRALPEIAPEDDATILFTSGSTGELKGALSTHRAVTTGVYAYATGLMVLLGIMTEENRAPASKRTLINVPLVPRHGRSAGDAQQLRHQPHDGDDGEMGCGRGASPDRKGGHHLFRRRADHEPGADEPSRPATSTICRR